MYSGTAEGGLGCFQVAKVALQEPPALPHILVIHVVVNGADEVVKTLDCSGTQRTTFEFGGHFFITFTSIE